jgi:diaminohydroxyphosphoribosylaminopyrimidine deaminase/5-amino-6-(5-phosphoribosylamino)uracil reductase
MEVSLDVLPHTTQALNAWYKKYITTMTPYVILKIAASRNGKISGFTDKYITSEASRRYVHALRSKVNAVLIGITTVLTDNPYLTDRFIAGRNPARIVIDPHLRLPLDSHFMKPDARRVVITGQKNDVAKIEKLIALGAEIVLLEGDAYSASAILEKLSSLRIGSVIVEGGGKVVTRFFEENCYDEFYCFIAPHEVADGVSLSEHIMHEIVAKDREPLKIGEDMVYHVYRNN